MKNIFYYRIYTVSLALLIMLGMVAYYSNKADKCKDCAVIAVDDNYTYSGYGFVIAKESGYVDIATAKHIVLTDNRPYIDIVGERLEGRMLYYAPNSDVAFIRVEAENVLLRKIETVSVSADMADYQTEYIDELYEEVILLPQTFERGDSGRGYYDENGSLIGMIIATSEDAGCLIPADSIYRIYTEMEEIK